MAVQPNARSDSLAVESRRPGCKLAVSQRLTSSRGVSNPHAGCRSPDVLTGDALADIWAETLAGPVSYAGDDLDTFETRMRSFMAGWMAYDMCLMMRSFQTEGTAAVPGDDEKLRAMLGRPCAATLSSHEKQHSGGRSDPAVKCHENDRRVLW